MLRTVITLGLAAAVTAAVVYTLPDVKRYIEVSRM